MEITIGSDFSGIGALEQALMQLNCSHIKKHACDMDKYARKSFIHNYGTKEDIALLETADVKFCDDIYYRLYIDKNAKKTTFAEKRKLLLIQEQVARSFSFYYPYNVYYRRIDEESLDLYITSPPCQAFSNAGKRLGKLDKRGILFFNSLDFISKNKPRFFVFENVKGLLSHDKTNKKAEFGNTFQEWINYLGGKSVNGKHVFFPSENSVPYHIYFQVINAKNYGVPQNRERVFIIGIRDDEDNNYDFPKPFPLLKRLKDVLEQNVPEKYFLSQKMLDGFIVHKDRHVERGNGFQFSPKEETDIATAITSSSGTRSTDNYLQVEIWKTGFINQDTQASQVFDENGVSPSICAGTKGYANGYIESNNPNELNQIGSLYENNSDARRIYDVNGIACTLKSEGGGLGAKTGLYEVENDAIIGAFRGRNPENPKSIKKGDNYEQTLEINKEGISNTLSSVQKDNVVILGYTRDKKGNVTSRHEKDIANSIHTATGNSGNTDQFVMEDKLDFTDGEFYFYEKETTVYEMTCGCGNSYIGFLSDDCKRCDNKTPGYTNEVSEDVQNYVFNKHKNRLFERFPQLEKTYLKEQKFLKIKSNTKKGYDKAEEEEEDSINFSNKNSKTKRGRVGKNVSQTIDTSCNQGIYHNKRIRRLMPRECLNLMDFSHEFKIVVSDTQIYKQTGNSIVVKPFALIIEKLINKIKHGKKN